MPTEGETTLGAEDLRFDSDALEAALESHKASFLSPRTRKSEKGLRSFSMREAAGFMKVNYNSFRNYLKTLEGAPDGELFPGNRRMFTLEEIHEIQRLLFEAGRIPPMNYPRRGPKEPMSIICVASLKGGSSKTTTAVNVAVGLAASGYRVAIVDLDPQASASDLLDVRPDIDGVPSVYDVMKYDDPMPITQALQKTYFPGIEILAGTLSMSEFEFETSATYMDGRHKEMPWHTRLKRAFRHIDNRFDVILIDTPPSLSFSVLAAMHASNGMIIPLSASMLDAISLMKFINLAADSLEVLEAQSANNRFNFIRYLITRHSPQDGPQVQLAAFLRTHLGKRMMRTALLHSTAMLDVTNTMDLMIEVSPGDINRKTYERIMESLAGISAEVEADILRFWGRIPSEGAA